MQSGHPFMELRDGFGRVGAQRYCNVNFNVQAKLVLVKQGNVAGYDPFVLQALNPSGNLGR
ncbi:MAG: hypothetical protein RL702_2771 [Pseudomonadota bacterium]